METHRGECRGRGSDTTGMRDRGGGIVTGPCPCGICNERTHCDKCHEVIRAKDPMYEHGEDYICQSCHEDYIDQAEVEHEGER